ncbi:MAG: 4Fe-4S binding protein [Pseudomonadota bacterium]
MNILSAMIARRGRLVWDPDAEKALSRVPAPVRPLARSGVEKKVEAQGRDRVTLADFEAAADRFGKGNAMPADLQKFMPQENRPGVPMVLVTACHARVSGCPNPVLDTDAWVSAIQDWARDTDLSERLRQRVEGGLILRHHKLAVSVSGCPNSCSRPQIADFGLTGTARPKFDSGPCTGCGACVEACPDEAVRLEDGLPVVYPAACSGCLACSRACPTGCLVPGESRARLAAGGKLGRHPRLASPAGVFASPEEAMAAMDRVLEQYLSEARPGERLGAWMQRGEKEGSAQ